VFVVAVPFSVLMLFWAIRGLFIFIPLLVIGLWDLPKWLFSPQYRQSLRTLKPLASDHPEKWPASCKGVTASSLPGLLGPTRDRRGDSRGALKNC
jgi:hypothetical protein